MKRLSLILLSIALGACSAALTPEPDYGFEQSGTLTRNNPGLTPGMWYLLYEEPGSPGLTVRLSFDEDVQCVQGETTEPCDRSVYAQGLRVIVRGEQEADGGVHVMEMELE